MPISKPNYLLDIDEDPVVRLEKLVKETAELERQEKEGLEAVRRAKAALKEQQVALEKVKAQQEKKAKEEARKVEKAQLAAEQEREAARKAEVARKLAVIQKCADTRHTATSKGKKNKSKDIIEESEIETDDGSLYTESEKEAEHKVRRAKKRAAKAGTYHVSEHVCGRCRNRRLPENRVCKRIDPYDENSTCEYCANSRKGCYMEPLPEKPHQKSTRGTKRGREEEIVAEGEPSKKARPSSADHDIEGLLEILIQEVRGVLNVQKSAAADVGRILEILEGRGNRDIYVKGGHKKYK
ncbi:hypothetical protein BDQ17DRAFT_1333231 [Cyathus striatus]|nr:hypothetical protein BDQ17DRAFT_1333231 [Cyathus striatus]